MTTLSSQKVPTPIGEATDVLAAAYFSDARALVDPGRRDRILDRHLALARDRGDRDSLVRTISAGETGPGPAVQIVGTDMPYLLEAVLGVLDDAAVTPEFVLHPVLRLHYGPDAVSGPVPVPPSDERVDDAATESWIHLALPPGTIDAAELGLRIERALARVRLVRADSGELERVRVELVGRLRAAGEHRAADFLAWCRPGVFRLLGADGATDGGVGEAAFGLLRDRGLAAELRELDASVFAITPVPAPAGLGGDDGMVAIRARLDGHLYLLVGTFAAVHPDVRHIPLVGDRVRELLAASGHHVGSFTGQAVLALAQTLPLTELLAADPAPLAAALADLTAFDANERMHLFLRRTPGRRNLSALLFVPRDRFGTAVRRAAARILVDGLEATNLESTSRISSAPLATVHLTMTVPDTVTVSEDVARRLGDRITAACQGWDERLLADVEADRRPALAAFASALPENYKQDFGADRARRDLAIVEELAAGDVAVRLVRSPEGPGTHRLSLYVAGRPASLGDLMPLLQSLGVEVLDERPYPLRAPSGSPCWIYGFTVRYPIAPDGDGFEGLFADAFTALWRGDSEPDRLGELVARAGLDWRAVGVLRAYVEFLRQAGFAYGSAHVADVLCAHPHIARALIDCFTARFDPHAAASDGGAAAAESAAELIEAVLGLDADRVLRALLGLIRNTVRTNHFTAIRRDCLALKFDSRAIDELPEPRPRHEIFVYSPAVAGVHLRFGAVARGGLRWSDRREDFRTEVLGLVKAQAVKNAVIVPVGAKGGFVLRRPPVPTGDAEKDRDALRAAGINGYRTFIRGLLDLTDNVDRTTGEVRPAPEVVRRDGDDTYLVVAADKGTATFSDIANSVAAEYDFWLGDAFASGGSVGYDHKAMGITARGAWESVTRHFRELGVDVATEEITAAGIGDMSGDVFGNGMLLSRHLRLVAAFDHRHVFLDPNPDAARSFAERERLFGLPRSSWADYDRTLISVGGGVWERSAKSVPISAPAARALGLDAGVTALTPPELIRAILRAPVDLLWNGGIGTYVKGADESHLDVGDKSNDAVRVDGFELRARVVGEGGNLGLTQAGRIEVARGGGRIGTDALDNSAGVDCSDREVNIKVLLDGLVGSGRLDAAARNRLLVEMTDDVAALVLADNVSQNELVGTARADAAEMLGVHARQIAALEASGALDRELEVLPDEAEIAARARAGRGLYSPELATLMAHVKLDLKATLLGGDLVDQDVFLPTLRAYFPQRLREAHADDIARHPLRREIVATALTNTVVDRGGLTHVFRLGEEVGAGPEDVVRAFTVVAEVFGLPELWARIAAAPVSTQVADELILVTRRLLERASRWLLTRRPQPLAVGAEIARFRDRISRASDMLDDWLVGADRDNLRDRTRTVAERGAPDDLVRAVEFLLDRFGLLDVVEIAELAATDLAVAGELYFRVEERVGLVPLLNRVSALPREGRWNALARLSLRDELYGTVRAMTLGILGQAAPGDTPDAMLDDWEHRNAARIRRARIGLAEIEDSGEWDLAALSVAAGQLRAVVG
ncbi:NAD-glutamate dehydrogenase [Rhodococcus sp. NPDC003322]